MDLRTDILFILLAKMMQPDLICDVGAMDARESLLFRKVAPNANIFVFEANPKNVEIMKRKGVLERHGIDIRHNAVWNKNGKLTFFVEKNLGESDLELRGISSTRRREKGSLGYVEITVSAVRLDSFVNNLRSIPSKIALWIDVEGAAYEVVDSFGEIRNQVKVVHLEAETKEFWPGQKLQPAVEELMEKMGFVLIGQRTLQPGQNDLLFVDAKTFKHQFIKTKLAITVTLFVTFLLRALNDAVRTVSKNRVRINFI